MKIFGNIFLGTLLIWLFFYLLTPEEPLSSLETMVAAGIVTLSLLRKVAKKNMYIC